MRMWLTEVLKLLGLSTPFVYAAAVYGFFHYLDKKASGKAKKAISGWLQPREYDKAAVADAMVEIFDRLYTRPLLGWRAFMRSALFTICMIAIFFYEFGLLSIRDDGNIGLMNMMTQVRQVWTWPILALGVLANVVCDYLALFIIRPFLIFGKRRPMLASLLAPIAGISIVLAAYYGFEKLVIFSLVEDFLEHVDKTGICNDGLIANPEGTCMYFVVQMGIAISIYRILKGLIMPAAFVVHLWLPLLVLSVAFLKSLNYLRLSVGGAQWFLKRGREHPLDAIGTVAAILVFVATAVIQHIDVIAVVLRPVAVWKMP